MQKIAYRRFPVKTLLALLLTGMAMPGFADMSVIRKPVDIGAYEMVYSTSKNAVLVATTLSRNENGGIVYELDAKNLSVIKAIDTAKKPFGAAINSRTNTAWFGGSIEGCVIAVDIISGKVKGITTLVPQSTHNEKTAPPVRERSTTQQEHTGSAGKDVKKHDGKRPPAPREVAVDEGTNTVYISGVNRDDSLLWVVDGNTMQLKQTIRGLGIMNTGLAVDSDNHRLYTSNAEGEFITIDTALNKVISRTRIVSDTQEHLLMNISLDKNGHRAFISDNKVAGIYVVDLKNSKVINHISVPESLAVLFNPKRNEIYATHRNEGTVSIINGTTYSVVDTVKLPEHPNSLVLAADGSALYVTVKQDVSHDKPATAPDDIVRISLD